MADEVIEDDNQLKSLFESHTQRMHEIFSNGYAQSNALCDEAILGVKSRSGLRSKVLDKALASLGIVAPVENT